MNTLSKKMKSVFGKKKNKDNTAIDNELEKHFAEAFYDDEIPPDVLPDNDELIETPNLSKFMEVFVVTYNTDDRDVDVECVEIITATSKEKAMSFISSTAKKNGYSIKELDLSKEGTVIKCGGWTRGG